MPNLRFGSVCSGIEAASVAWKPLGWEAAWFSEIEPFPSAVLAHHHPDVSNLGDMTTLPDRIRASDIEAPDVLCGGTPCQAFSVAGLRRSLGDTRGNLSLTFCEIANAIDDIRYAGGGKPAIIFWENVPGVLNTADNAFGSFLAGLAGEDDPLEPPRKKWANAGYVLGPQRAIAWRVLDAQYFGVAQRRRRVFVVASARNDFDPAAVLFEFEGVRRDSAPSRETGQTVAGTFKARANSGGWNSNIDLAAGNYMQPVTARMVSFGEYVEDDTASAMKARDYKDATDLIASHGLWWNGDQITPALTQTLHNQNGRGGHGGADNIGAIIQPIVFHPTQDPINSKDVCHSIGANDNATAAVAVDWQNSAGGPNSTETFMTLCKDRHPAVMQSMQVRRLTPVECERLQGFPDNYTAIPWRNKTADQCPDGPRYRALGNSWAVPVVSWIGSRISSALNQNTSRDLT